MNKKSTPWIISGVLVAILAVGGFWYFNAKRASAATSNYITGTVKYGDVKETVNATGTVQLPNEYDLSFNGQGKVTEINVKVGDSVKAGQVLAKIDQTAAQQQINQAQINLTQAELKLQQLQAPPAQVNVLSAQNEVNQAQSSFNNAENNLTSLKNSPNPDPTALTKAESTLNNAEAALNLAKAKLSSLYAGPNSTDLQLAQLQVNQAQSQLTQAKDGLNDTIITAPADGIISAVSGQIGEYPGSRSAGSTSGNGGSSGGSGNNSGSSAFIVLMGNSSTMQIVVPVDQSDIANVKVDQSAELTLDAYPDKTFTGKVTQVSPTANTQSGVTTFSVTIVADNSNGLMKSGMSSDVSIIVAQKQNVVTVPSMAVHDNNGSDTVTLAPANGSTRPQSVPVTIGIDDGTNAEVLQGLQADDQVIIGSRPTTSGSSSGSGLGSGRALGGMGGGFGGGMGGGGFSFGGGRNSSGGGRNGSGQSSQGR